MYTKGDRSYALDVAGILSRETGIRFSPIVARGEDGLSLHRKSVHAFLEAAITKKQISPAFIESIDKIIVVEDSPLTWLPIRDSISRVKFLWVPSYRFFNAMEKHLTYGAPDFRYYDNVDIGACLMKHGLRLD
jgi:hypothetical protein